MSEKNSSKIFFYIGLALTATAILMFFVFNKTQKFLLLNDAFGINFRCGIVASNGLIFTCFGLIKK